MIILKNEEEIKIMRKAGEIATGALKAVVKKARVGVSTLELDRIAYNYIKEKGAESSFKKVEDYKYTICATPNEEVVHGVPRENYKLKNGDILGIDVGAFYRGFHSDTAETILIGSARSEGVEKFLETGKRALKEAIEKAQVGNRVGDISSAIQTLVEGDGYSVVRELVGHGVGRELHEDPFVPGVGSAGKGELLKEGMVIAVEVIYNKGKPEVTLLDDGWTFVTKDRELSGLFENTVAITKKGPMVLTKL